MRSPTRATDNTVAGSASIAHNGNVVFNDVIVGRVPEVLCIP